jgi:hypothetical protein
MPDLTPKDTNDQKNNSGGVVTVLAACGPNDKTYVQEGFTRMSFGVDAGQGRTRGPHEEDTVADGQQLAELDHPQHKVVLRLQTHLHRCVADCLQ